jgi:hypothetical protein
VTLTFSTRSSFDLWVIWIFWEANKLDLELGILPFRSVSASLSDVFPPLMVSPLADYLDELSYEWKLNGFLYLSPTWLGLDCWN